MKKNLRSACLLILVFLSFIAGFVGMGSAENISHDYTFNEKSYTGFWGNLSSPTSEYNIWGYPDKNYTFTTTYNHSLFSNKRVIVFYWDCKNNKSNYKTVQMSNKNCSIDENGAYCSNCTNIWNKNGTYYVSAAIYENGKPINVSYWTTVEIRNNTCITVQNFSMMDEKEGFDGNNSAHIYKISNFSEIMLGEKKGFNCSNSTYNVSNLENFSKNCCYCGYKDTDYSFSTCLNATCQKGKGSLILPGPWRQLNATDITPENLLETDTRTIGETTTVIEWGDDTSGNSIFGSISNETVISHNNAFIKSDNSTAYIEWNKNFTHEWDDTGIKTINAKSFHWDPLDGNESYSNSSNISVLIIQDPKYFFFPSIILKGIPFNLHNWGIFLSIIGLIIFYFTYTRNNVPIEISIFGLKPFYLKSVNSLTGTLIFVAGMYLYFVFGKCPWDIPIINGLSDLRDMYFGILYREYETKPFPNIPGLPNIPYLSILIGMLDVIILSLIIHMIAIPFYKGEFKIGEFLRRKLSSTSSQPELVPYSVEDKINQEN